MLKQTMRFSVFFALLVGLSLPAAAQQRTIYHLNTGTGFVVNDEGYVITNAHVVDECQSISILTPAGEQSATLIDRDTQNDLAALKSNYFGKSPAILRSDLSSLRTGTPVNVTGFPGKKGAFGQILTKKTTISSLVSPTGEPDRIQLKTAISKGNSGGPVLDGSGTVIGVITGMAETYRTDADHNPIGKPVAKNDVAIALPILKDFLTDNNITYTESNRTKLTQPRDFIVSVRCVKDIVRTSY